MPRSQHEVTAQGPHQSTCTGTRPCPSEAGAQTPRAEGPSSYLMSLQGPTAILPSLHGFLVAPRAIPSVSFSFQPLSTQQPFPKPPIVNGMENQNERPSSHVRALRTLVRQKTLKQSSIRCEGNKKLPAAAGLCECSEMLEQYAT